MAKPDVFGLAALMGGSGNGHAAELAAARAILLWAQSPVLRFAKLNPSLLEAVLLLDTRGWEFIDRYAARHVAGGVNVIRYDDALNRMLMRPQGDFEPDATGASTAPRPLPGLFCGDDATELLLRLPAADERVLHCDLRGIDPARALEAHVEIELPPMPGHWRIHAPLGTRIKVKSSDPEGQTVSATGWHDQRPFRRGRLNMGCNAPLGTPPPEPLSLPPSRASR